MGVYLSSGVSNVNDNPSVRLPLNTPNATTEAVDTIISDLVDAKDFWACAQRFNGATVSRMQKADAAHIVQSFQKLYEQGFQEEAIQYIKSYKQNFKFHLQYKAAFKRTAEYCLRKRDVANAILLAESTRGEKPDEIKCLVIEAVCAGVPSEDLSPAVISFLLSFKDTDWKKNYIIKYALQLLLDRRFEEIKFLFLHSQLPFEDLFERLLLAAGEMRHVVQELTFSIEDDSLRNLCLNHCDRWSNPQDEIIDNSAAKSVGKRIAQLFIATCNHKHRRTE